MSEPLKEIVEKRIAVSTQIIDDLNHQRRRWVMSIPARVDYDPDIVLSATLSACQEYIAALEAERDAVRDSRKRLVCAIRIKNDFIDDFIRMCKAYRQALDICEQQRNAVRDSRKRLLWLAGQWRHHATIGVARLIYDIVKQRDDAIAWGQAADDCRSEAENDAKELARMAQEYLKYVRELPWHSAIELSKKIERAEKIRGAISKHGAKYLEPKA